MCLYYLKIEDSSIYSDRTVCLYYLVAFSSSFGFYYLGCLGSLGSFFSLGNFFSLAGLMTSSASYLKS